MGDSFVFVSYAHANNKSVLPIIDHLKKSGINVWYDNYIESGKDWVEYVAEKVVSCTKFVLFMSNSYLDSKNCKRELNLAISREKEILTIYLEDVELSLGMEMQLNTYQAIFRSKFLTDTLFIKKLGEDSFFNNCKDSSANWKKNYKVFDIGGDWFLLMLSEEDRHFVRIGKATIKQNFEPDQYMHLYITGGYSRVSGYDLKSKSLTEDFVDRCCFFGEYTLKNNGDIFGIYHTEPPLYQRLNTTQKRNSDYGRGVHDFFIDMSDTQNVIEQISGEFHDLAPSMKQGVIYLFKHKKERDLVLLEHRADVL